MGLRQLIPLLILIIQLYNVEIEAVTLPRLRDNKLFEGDATILPGDHAQLQCGEIIHRKAKSGARKTLSQALTSYNFGRYGFTTGPLSSYQSPKVLGTQEKFKFNILSGSKTIYALTIDPAGELAYWLPQGDAIEVPQHPKHSDPKYVLSVDFSGCSWTVTPMANGNMTLRHITGGQEGPQFNRKSTAEKGGPVTYAMQYVDYGYDTNVSPVLENCRAFAYMHYTGRYWEFHFQRKKCSALPGSSEFKNGFLSSMHLNDNTGREQISSVKSYTIP